MPGEGIGKRPNYAFDIYVAVVVYAEKNGEVPGESGLKRVVWEIQKSHCRVRIGSG